MLQFLLDTDHLTLYQLRHAPLLNHLATLPLNRVGVSVVTVEEALRGRLAALARARDGKARIRLYPHFLASVQLFSQLQVVPFDQACEDQFQQLRALRLRIGSQDLKIAATALANQLVLITRNTRDFARVPGLRVDDWST